MASSPMRAADQDGGQHLGVDLISPEREEDIDTIGGSCSRLPAAFGARRARAPSGGVEFEVLDADSRLIKRLRIHKPQEREDAIASESA
jgi:Mg2+/Co2+ transporter CorC